SPSGPAKLAALREDPVRVPTAVEELLRRIPLRDGLAAIRIAIEDVELGGVVVRAGEAVLPLTASANRDGRCLPDPNAETSPAQSTRISPLDMASTTASVSNSRVSSPTSALPRY